jgi:Family of unknown function (DUF6951)
VTAGRVEIYAGICGHTTTVVATATEGYTVAVRIESSCPHVRDIGTEVTEVEALQQIGLRGWLPPVLMTAYSHCVHAACPVPAGLIKAIEVAVGLALPQDVSMRISKEE